MSAARSEVDQDDPRLTILRFDDLIESAIEALGWNYRIGPAEAELLGLFAFDSRGLSPDAWRVLKAVIDEAMYMEWLKKKVTAMSQTASDGESTAAGAAD